MARPKKVSMQDIANRLGISKNAVSLALSGKKGVSESVRRSVLAAAEELGYGTTDLDDRPTRSSRNVLVLVPERVVSYTDNEHFHFFHDMLWILEESIRAKGCNAVIARIDRKMEEGLILPGLFTDVQHIGIILFGITAKPYAQMIWDTDVPLVMLDSYYRDLPCAAAVSANTEGAEAAVRWLIQRGHRKIGFIGPANLTTSHEERWFGYWRATREAGLPIEERHALLEASDFDEEKNEREIGRFLERIGMGPSSSADLQSRIGQQEAAIPTAFFCGNDRLALLLIRRLRAMDISVPQSVEVAGFDGLKQATESGAGLSATVRVDKRKMCEAAVELLLGGHGDKREALRAAVTGELRVVDDLSAGNKPD
ncbi:LacI family DNA-binding transcriptional regulator [Saccharibacillus kuerlensis]|uniref:LacI family transcriptional regulator n=1 Tax=Saccharibacillus kuerlensis TaxID=459527 RepID=A0ABQ2L4K6_9BACL|nr:LacI family DNA-binding transcriptional regulator [Saccharibacillus kuerlensis]GGO02961.1 LacI family transcriptional regulator [Saccharibacillus kuerlensis]